jgi:hypothetical protein
MKIKSLKFVFSKIKLLIKNFKKTKPQLFWIIFACLILLLFLITTISVKAMFFKSKLTSNTKVSANTVTINENQPKITGAWEIQTDQTPTPIKEILTPIPLKDTVSLSTFNNFTITWLNNPRKIEPLDIFNLELSDQRIKMSDDPVSPDDPNFTFSDAEFFQIGIFSNGAELIDVYFDSIQPIVRNTVLARLITDKNNIYFLQDMVVNSSIDNIQDYLKDNVTLTTFYIKELADFPPTIGLGGDNILHISSSTKGSSRRSGDLSSLKKISDSQYGEIYSSSYSIFDDIPIDQMARKSFYLKTKDANFITYHYDSEDILDDQVPQIIWNSGQLNTDTYNQTLGFSCGSEYIASSPVVINNSDLLKNKVEVGKTKSGTSVYQIKDSTNILVRNLYYQISSNGLSLNDFALINNHFLLQNPSGDWQIFVNDKYSVQAECGKPVIYLYPQTETQVKVQVGAQITKSEPTYPTNGWLVTANPNGELTYQNQSYPYLFWEGLGNGIYPDYRDQGTLVSQKDLVSTVYKQLSELGLNQKESADFMEFWQPRLPKTPYVRLTWLNTQDMNRLAPLFVSPKPDTSIRIFLEFQGLEKPITLKPQKLIAPQRNGFTLIEWGGLLISSTQ